MSSSPASVPLIGRESELAALGRLAGVTGTPRSGLVLLHGDAGMGKSRLLSALGAQAAAQGWRVAVGHCLDLGGSPMAYLPFSELAAQLEATRPARMSQLAERWPDLRRLLAHQHAGDQPEAPDRGRFFGSLHAVLSELGREAPLLLLIEDVHWADQSTCDLLSFLFSRGFSEPVSLVVTYRSDDLHRRHPLRTIAAGWARLPGVSRLALEPLPDEQVRRLVLALGPGLLGEGEVQTIIERAEGNAFFTEELVAAVGSRALPRDLAGLLLLRLDQLEPDARAVVRAASAGARLVPDAVLADVTGLVGERFEAAVRTAVELNVLVPDGDSYRFRHSMLSEAVYDDLLPGERRRVHAAYVAALTATNSRASAAEVARHAVAAEDRATAYAASVRAGDDAAAVGGPDEAARHYAMALDLLGSQPAGDSSMGSSSETVGLVEKAAQAAAHAGLVQRAEAIVAAQLSRLPADAPPVERARLLIALAEAAALSDSSTDVIAVTAEALALIPPEPHTQWRSRAVASHAVALGGARRDAEAVRWAEEGLAMPPEVRAGEVTIQLQTVLARISERSGDAVASRRILQELAEATAGTADPSEVRVLHQLAGIYLEQGELDEALQTYRRAARRSAEVGRPFAPYGVDSRILAGLVAHQLGRWDLALEIADLRADEAPPLAAAGLLSVTLTVRAGRGETADWQALMERVRPQWSTDGMVAVHSAAAAIDLAGTAGGVDGPLTVFDEAVSSVGRTWGTTEFQARIRLTSLLLGQLAGSLADLEADRRRALVARAQQLSEAAQCATGMGRRPRPGLESQAWLQRLDAELLRLRSAAGEPVEPGEQVAAWQGAVEGFRRYGHVFEQARSQARLSAALRAAGDTAQSLELARAALPTAERLGALPLVAELRPLAGTARTPGTSSVEVLTPREREVLRLVAEGRTNPEIGQGLFISTKTASVHVSNILAKLQAKTRTEAVSVAQRRGLLERSG
ncbi:MAG TPA: AAA family ATPase [Propionibacteriaceae bacterium]|nr:AAA family ATPase [Propionibacteriaceae bacterium]